MKNLVVELKSAKVRKSEEYSFITFEVHSSNPTYMSTVPQRYETVWAACMLLHLFPSVHITSKSTTPCPEKKKPTVFSA